MRDISDQKNAPADQKLKTSNPMRFIWPILFMLSLLFGLWSNYRLVKNNQVNALKLLKCQEEAKQQAIYADIYNQLSDQSNQTIMVSATENYSTTKLFFHLNSNTEKAYLQIEHLPTIESDQSFQLWSLKDGSDPVPLDVFNATANRIFEVDFVSGSNAYAITIEPEGGQDKPTLEKLIGVFSIAG